MKKVIQYSARHVLSSLLFALPAVQGLCAATPAAGWNPPAVDSLEALVAIQGRVQSLLPKVTPAVVGLQIGNGSGSAVVVSSDGLLLTAGHVTVRPGQQGRAVFSDGREQPMDALGCSFFTDAGMGRLRDAADLAHVEVAPEGSCRVGDWCFALGHPSGVDGDRGMVLRIGRIISIRNHVMRTDCPLIGGDSGGPLFDLEGRVIGIHSRISISSDDNFHVPTDSFRKDWDAMLAKKVLRPGKTFFGVVMAEHDAGVLVRSVVPHSSAARAGIQPGDIITHVDGQLISDPQDLGMAISSRSEEEKVTIGFVRGTEEKEVRAVLGTRNTQPDPSGEEEDGP